MTREELLRSPEWWEEEIKVLLYNLCINYMEENNLTKEELRLYLGCSNNCINKIFSGDFDYKISLWIDILIKLNKVPVIQYKNINDVIEEDKIKCKGTKEYDKKD